MNTTNNAEFWRAEANLNVVHEIKKLIHIASGQLTLAQAETPDNEWLLQAQATLIGIAQGINIITEAQEGDVLHELHPKGTHHH